MTPSARSGDLIAGDGTKNGLSRSEQKTVSTTQNNRLTGKAPYKSTANLPRVCGKEPIPWLDRLRERRRKFVAQLEVDRLARSAIRRPNTQPSHDLAEYAGDYEHPAYGQITTGQPHTRSISVDHRPPQEPAPAEAGEAWTEEHARWQKRDLSAKRYVYCWADGIHLEARLEEQAQCILVIIGATPEGRKELVGFTDGIRESSQSWRDLLLDLKRRGLTTAPQIAVADGALGFWKALGEVWPTTREQRCWVHKTANILNKLPKSLHTKAKRALQEIWMAETKKDAVKALEAFVETYQVKYKRATDCLIKDRDALLAFYDFPAEHWKHLRTTNPIESTFATVRHRTIRSKGCLSNKTALAMVFKLVDGAQKSWRRIDGHNQLPKLIQGVKFTDGIEVIGNSAVASSPSRRLILQAVTKIRR